MRPRPVKLSRLVEGGRISPMSPVVLISEKLGIRWLNMFDGEYVYGPTPGLIEVSDLLIKAFKPRSLIDLFGGSGAVSKLASRNGVRRIIYVDLYSEAAELNLGGEKAVTILRRDAFEFMRSGVKADVLILDPPEELIPRALKALIEFRSAFRKAALIWIGPVERSKRYAKALRRRRMIEVLDAWGDSFAVFWKPGLGDRVSEVKRLLE